MDNSPASQQRFARDVLIASAANLLRSLRNLILIPLIAGHLSLAHYGEWDLLAVAIAFFIPWITFSLNSALLRFLPGCDDATVREGFYSIFFFVLISSATAGLALWALAAPLSTIAELAPLHTNAPAIASVLVCSSLLGLVQSYFRAFRLMLGHSALSLAQHFGEILLIAYLLQGGSPLTDALWSLAGTRGLLTAIGLARIVAHRGFAWPRFTHLRGYLAFAIPLIPNSLFYRLYDSADKFFLYAFIGSAAVGGYAAAYIAGSLFTTLASPIHTVLLPAMATLWNQDKREEIAPYLARTIRLSALLTFPALAGVFILADPLLTLLLHEEAAAATQYYQLLAVSFILFSFGIPFGDLMVTAGQSRQLFFLNGSLALVNLLLNVLMIPRLGILGAVISTLACHTAYTVATGLMARASVAYSIPWRALMRIGFAATAMGIALHQLFGPTPQTLLLPILSGIGLYTALLFALRELSKEDFDFFAALFAHKR
ncbi:MAG: oligosaccharide flippase family protein [Gemmatimonadetes bacterium]|nr:oligosaccharide flippase family protein [Gemmatimonadota bacterium]MBT6908136.1 oligosaccharide flippase family protein [Gemmatimonadota bacterium]MBT7421579.1 oligosaccharide flippase family protein [Gemmatimonadota bacterium]